MSYQDDLKSHLSSYKKSVLGISVQGEFIHQGRVVLYDHILPKVDADLNLLPIARSLEGSFRKSRHRYFHHLNSSQAFAFNLFLPFFRAGGTKAQVLLEALGQTVPLKSWEFEAVPSKKEGTNLDALWITDDEVTTLCEVKLSETEFGTAKDDLRHNAKLASIYLPILTGHVNSKLLKAPEFFGAYQILRNVWHLCNLHEKHGKGLLIWV